MVATSVSDYQRIRRQQILREAEGYLDLIMVLSEQWPLRTLVRDRIAQRVLESLAPLERATSRRAQTLFLKGQALRAMERYADAIVPLRAASELDGQDIHVWLALGWCYKRIGRLDLAIQSLEESLSVDPNQAIIHYNLACYWSLAKNAKLAVAYLSRAFDIDSNYRDLVLQESDFDAIRNHPRFQALTSVIV
jgi:tetratricopeptide (TPR) repeat protein